MLFLLLATFSVAVFDLFQCSCECWATVFDGKYCKGRSLKIYHQNANLSNDYFDNRIESLSLSGPCHWLFYKEPHFKGNPVHLLKPGVYFRPDKWEGTGNEISSIRAIPPEGRVAICVFSEVGFKGRMMVLEDSNPDLPDVDFDKQISSVIVTGGNWILYAEIQYVGARVSVGKGRYSNVDDLDIGMNTISSVKKMMQ